MTSFKLPVPALGSVSHLWLASLLTSVCVIVTVSASEGDSTPPASALTMTTEFCEHWKTYKDPRTGRCLPCSHCPDNYVTVVLCEFDRDTLCRPSSDLGTHIQSVVHSSVTLSAAVNQTGTFVMVEEDAVLDGSTNYSIILLVMALSALLVACLVLASLYLVRRKCLARLIMVDADTLSRSLLEDEEDGEDDGEADAKTVTLDMDELLAQRYGRSLVTNNYVR